MNNQRIGLIGTCCVGKSTLTTLLTMGSGLAYIREDARDLYEERMKDPNWKREDPHMQLALQYEIFASKFRREMAAFQKGFIADRTYLDNFMYYIYYSHKVIEEAELLAFEHMSRNAMQLYTHLFVLDLGRIPYVADAVRTENFATSLFYETSIYGLIQRWNLNVHRVPDLNSADFICDVAGLGSMNEKWEQENQKLKSTYETLKNQIRG